MGRAKVFDILGLGAVAVDDFIHVEQYPQSDEKARVISRQRRVGGLTAIALLTAARLGARCAYAGVLGDDELSQFVLEFMQGEKIDVRSVKRTPSARPIYSNVVVDRRGTRNIFFDVEGVVGADPRVSSGLVESCKVLFVDNFGLSGMIRAAHAARRAGIPVVADFESHTGARFHELLALVDHLILSRGFAHSISGKTSPDRAVRTLAEQGHQAVVVTCGAEGCWFWSRELMVVRRLKAFKVNAVDTTGCGDVFHGAYAFALARKIPLLERLQFASAAAALKAAGQGGLAAIPSLPRVKKFLKHEIPF